MGLGHILCQRYDFVRWSRTRELLACHCHIFDCYYDCWYSTIHLCGYGINGMDVPHLFRLLQC